MIVVAACFRSETRKIRPRAGVRVIHTGMGASAAVDLSRALGDGPLPDLLVSTGFCGATAPDLRVGDLVIACEVRSEGQAERFRRALAEKACRILARHGIPSRLAPVECPTRIARRIDKEKLAARGIAAVDLETATLACWAAARSVPFASCRAVLDTAGEDLPFPPDRPLWLSVLQHPGATARVAKAAGVAAERLGAAINCLVEAWEADA